ncbi:MAG: hypothetical protein PHF86_05130 [Candidatus Nanoarchaeia archaeon]|jgi:hypothetical protein|nr:hypothetical protein [Candidatus Nanoarchaeia archaeon]
MFETLECVQCGFCCTLGPCPFGDWNPITHQCNYLTVNNKCSKYDEIKQNPFSNFSPAFDTGCSSTIGNIRRKNKIRELLCSQK